MFASVFAFAFKDKNLKGNSNNFFLIYIVRYKYKAGSSETVQPVFIRQTLESLNETLYIAYRLVMYQLIITIA